MEFNRVRRTLNLFPFFVASFSLEIPVHFIKTWFVFVLFVVLSSWGRHSVVVFCLAIWLGPWPFFIDPCIAVLCHGWHRGMALCGCGEIFILISTFTPHMRVSLSLYSFFLFGFSWWFYWITCLCLFFKRMQLGIYLIYVCVPLNLRNLTSNLTWYVWGLCCVSHVCLITCNLKYWFA